jgi:hypothetical protein
MKGIIIFLIAGAVFAAPCVTDIISTEPSPLAGGIALVSSGSEQRARNREGKDLRHVAGNTVPQQFQGG